MDKLLGHCGTTVMTDRAMDSNEHEKERGITIMSKYTRLYCKNDYQLHVVDTPGHADFGGEVERILSMVDGVVLLVDASEGPMSQTKFVLSKALAAKKKTIVVINKIDRKDQRVDEVENEILDLFLALAGEEAELLDYPVLYASARQGWVTRNIREIPGKEGVIPLLDAIVEYIPPAAKTSDLAAPFALCVNTISSDPHLGRIVTGKVERGELHLGTRVNVLSRESKLLQTEMKVTKLFYLEGLQRVDISCAKAGEIVSIAGTDASVSDTVCMSDVTTAIATPAISPPILSMTFGPNDSPLAGKEGSKLTSSLLRERLIKEVENNVTLTLRASNRQVTTSVDDIESMDVQGRGELQLGILVETLRREGFELTISPPRVLSVLDPADNLVKEPYEEVSVDVDIDLQGVVIDAMSHRAGHLLELKEIGAERTRLVFTVPSRGMIGFRYEVLTATRGNATVNSIFSHYAVVDKSLFAGLRKGKLVCTETGKATGYALMSIEERGVLYISPNEEVYEGMVIGENSKSGDLDVNACKSKKLSNVRSTGAEEKVQLSTPKRMSIEQVMANIDEDEVIEITPKNIRLRKRILNTSERLKHNRQFKQSKL
jgi:GTP-binding protein